MSYTMLATISPMGGEMVWRGDSIPIRFVRLENPLFRPPWLMTMWRNPSAGPWNLAGMPVCSL